MKFTSLISSGIDSPVATYLFLKKSKEITLIHADGRPFTDDREINNFLSLGRKLKNLSNIKLKLYLKNSVQSSISYVAEKPQSE